MIHSHFKYVHNPLKKWFKYRDQLINILKDIYEKYEKSPLNTKLLNVLPFWVGSILTGIVAILYAELFAVAENINSILFHRFGWWFLLFSIIFIILAYQMVRRYAKYAAGSGIPQVTAAIKLSNPKDIHLVNHLLSLKIVLIKILSSIFFVLGGGAIGREGPTIQISASIFKAINDRLPEWYPRVSRKNMLVTGAAAGLAAAFNTPLGGVVFAIEELTQIHFNYFRSALLAGVIIAGFTTLQILGPYLYLGYPSLNNISFSFILSIIPIALLAGMAGSGMGAMVLKLSKLKMKFKKQIWVPIIVSVLLVSSAMLINYNTLGSGKEIIIDSLFNNKTNLEWYIPIVRFFNTSISFSTGAAGGIFAPSLSLGASIGSVFSDLLHTTTNESHLLVLCGMAACLTGVTRSPFTSSIIIIEMTNTHNVIFHIMMAALIANLISSYISKDSLYEQLEHNYLRQLENQ